jgi:hypothetical protein
MGSGGAKTTNRMLGEQNQKTGALQDLATGWSKEAHAGQQGDIGWARNSLMDMYNGIGAGGEGGGGGGGGPAFPGWEKLNWEDPRSFATLKNFMDTGGYSDADKGNILSYGTAPISGMADMLKRGMGSAARGSGVGYASGLGNLYKDQAYQASEAAKGIIGGLMSQINANKFRGAEDITGIDTEKRAFGVSERDKAYAAAKEARAAALARAGAGRAAAENSFNQKRSLIHDILGLEDNKDLEYFDRALGAGGQVYAGINSRQNETPLWQRSLGAILPSAAAAGMGAFAPSGKKKTSGYGSAGAPPTPYGYG